MGDLWQVNIIVSIHQESVRVFLLDWELARTGLPGSEIGLFCSNLHLLARWNQVASQPALVILQSFIDSYSRAATRDTSLAQDTSSHWGISNIFWAPRALTGADKELVQDLMKEGVMKMVQSRNQDFLAHSHVKSLLPE
jgi:aminoglycoside phosphotransferase (APT) family kinase protein